MNFGEDTNIQSIVVMLVEDIAVHLNFFLFLFEENLLIIPENNVFIQQMLLSLSYVPDIMLDVELALGTKTNAV